MSKVKDFFNKLMLVAKQFLVIFLYFIVVVSLQLTFIKDISSTNMLIASLSSIFVELLVLTIFIFIFRKTLIPDYYDFKRNGKIYFKKGIKYWIIGLVIMIISNLIISNFIGMASNEEANQSILKLMPVYSTIVMIIIAPITEELLTRVCLKSICKKPYLYIILSGLIFGSLHLLTATSTLELFYIIPYGALGGAFAYMYYKTNNIWTNITFHAIHNFIALVLFFLGA